MSQEQLIPDASAVPPTKEKGEHPMMADEVLEAFANGVISRTGPTLRLGEARAGMKAALEAVKPGEQS